MFRAAQILCLCSPFLAVVIAPGQSVRWKMDSGSNSVDLVFENCVAKGTPVVPAVAGLSFSPAGNATSHTASHGATSTSNTLRYFVRGARAPEFTIPEFTVATDKGDLVVPAFTAAFQPLPVAKDMARSTLTTDSSAVWVGQVFKLDYALLANRRVNPQISPRPEGRTPLVAEEWSEPEVVEETIDGDRHMKVNFHRRAIAATAGRISVGPFYHKLSVQMGTTGFGFIQQPRMQQIEVTSNSFEIEARALPPPPPDFSEAVGDFKLTSNIVPREVAVGEPITWTLVLTGTGNWWAFGGLPTREVSTDFSVVQPMHKRVRAAGKFFDTTLTEDVVLLPSKPGHYTLGAVTFTYFDPETGSYQTLTAPGATVTVTANANIPAAASGTPKSSPGDKTQKVGGTREKQAATDATSPALAQPRAALDAVNAKDSPMRLFQLIRRTEGELRSQPIEP